ncbi:putative DnaA protein [Cellulophaga phage phi46:1]|uniref:putative DnaA protein n=1 Tax=Cellulophaga phage phi46:1 TaxID=1327974 RepID=UPI000351619C|nr:putative DnaA protein [Cellulophaga phage phi46:1]AGO47851.1 putative DnaA protein [Cellulophaga phage phi46:1]
MKLTPQAILKLVEDYSGLDLKNPSRKPPYVKARVIYARLCAEHLIFIFSLDECGGLINKDHSSMSYYSNKAFYAEISNDTFAEFYIEMSEQIKAVKRIEKLSAPIIETEIDKDDKLDILQQQLVVREVEIKRLKEASESEIIKEISLLNNDQREALHERIKPALMFVKRN